MDLIDGSEEGKSGIFWRRMNLKRFVVRSALLQEPFWLTMEEPHRYEESSRNKEFAHANIRVFVPLITPIIRIVENHIRFSTSRNDQVVFSFLPVVKSIYRIAGYF